MSLPAPSIGVFDSGLGGLTVLREIRRQMPEESVLYLADTANVPYGDKPIGVVRDLALRLTDCLVEAGVKVVIMASGTSTVAGLEAARERYPQLPVIGTIEPGAAAAVAWDGPIGVLATNATAHSLAFTQAVQALNRGRRVVEQGCPKFVPLVESGQAETEEAEEAACEYLRPLRVANVQTIILGCTHFPFLLPVLQKAARHLNFCPHFVDPSELAVRHASEWLPLAPVAVSPSITFAATGDPELFRRHASALLDEPLPPVVALCL